jgi:hypothetical protein
MNYYKDENNQVFGYDDTQVKQGYGKNLTAITEEEKNKLLALPLDKVKQNKKQELKTNFINSFNDPVEVNGVNYSGGYESGQKLDAKRRMIKEKGGTEVQYLDQDDNIITHTLDEALQVCLAVSNDYETKFYRYKQLCKEVNSKLKVSTVESIVW